MISDRIEALITHFCKGNKSLFAQQIGVRPSVIGNITGERKGNPSFEVIQKILDAFASVNPEWFILDKGSMLRNEHDQPSKPSVTHSTQPTSPVEESFIYKMYKEKDEENKALIRENGHLEERVRMLESKLSDCAKPDAVKVQELVLESPATARPAATKQRLSTSEPSASYAVSPLQKQ